MWPGYCFRERDNSLATQDHRPTTELQQILANARQEWTTSPAYHKIRHCLDTAPSRNLTKVVAFALGSMFLDSQTNEHSTLQHAFLSTLPGLVSPVAKSGEFNIFAQDPLYCLRDKQVLQAENITVLDDPLGFLEVDESTVGLSIGPDCPVKEIILDISRPAVIIWEAWKCVDPI